ncbi:putative adenine phosphoribosyltransferase [Piptocephalis cylindrospora]|uniref:adenine phosphoribosyltransferase n=1 Tax=Piptocephalis cylindrospora TaxID=1907219 RepID=A0A4P9Y5Y0_9FUNG|nr:putative adenine phosphoribosyltransferase [Piptocephalis cylindrospora]|eukprot:RKP14363.1 putative adenine phosphoribosyltransferase [Piptocephalis cylindrospora]
MSKPAVYDLAHIQSLVRAIPDFPHKGIVFQDIFPIFQDPVAIESLTLHLLTRIKETLGEETNKVDVVVGLDARGFLFGPALAIHLGAAFVPVRKQGKLPGACTTASYSKEYGTDVLEVQEGAIRPGQRVIIIDDLIATGGTAAAAGELVRKSKGTIAMYLFVIELLFLKGRDKLEGGSVESLLHYED